MKSKKSSGKGKRSDKRSTKKTRDVKGGLHDTRKAVIQNFRA